MDLKNDKAHPKHISKDEGEKCAKKINAIGYFETSSKPPSIGISELFDAIKKAANEPFEPIGRRFCTFL